MRWILGGTAILSSWSYAYFVIAPANVWLAAMPPKRAVSTLRELMRDWGLLEWGHVLIGLVARLSPAAQQGTFERGLSGREPLKRRSDHRAECRAAREFLPGKAARDRLVPDTSFRPSIIPCKCAAAFSMS